MDQNKEIFYHPGLGKTGTTYLQYKFFPKLKGINYIQRTKYNRITALIQKSSASRILVSREFDRQFFDEVDKFAAHFPDAHPILVLRRHDKWIASQYRRLTKNGRGHTFKEFIDIEKNDGRWDKRVLNFYERIQFLEEKFSHKPLVLFHEELKNNPQSFFDKIAQFTGADYNINNISLSSKHVSYNEKQLKAVRNFARKTFFKWKGKHLGHDGGFERRFRKVVSHLIMYVHFLFPKDTPDNEPLIPEKDLEAIRKAYADDWQKCVDYAKNNPVERLV